MLVAWHAVETAVLSKLTVKDFRCLKDVSLSLTPLHVLIGPNDSGKSTLLQAVHMLSAAAGQGSWQFEALKPLFESSARWPSLSAELPDGRAIEVFHETGAFVVRLRPGDVSLASFQENGGNPGSHEEHARNAVSPALFVRLNPTALREPSELIPEKAELTFGEAGTGLAGVYEAILSRGDESFREIADRVRRLFPTVKRLWVPTTERKLKELAIELHDGTEVRSGAMSEGLLYYLAFEALTCIRRPAVLLIEEPENGLHPARIAEVMKLLRGIAEDASRPAQVVIATHSPLVVNEAKPEEVTVVTRDVQRGTRCVPLKDTPNFEQRSKVYALGELWLSYANGKDESALWQDACQAGPS